MNELAKMECVPCKGGIPPLKGDDLKAFHARLGAQWALVNDHHLEREYVFGSFKEAMAFTNRIAEMSDTQGHHSVMLVNFKKVKLTVWTHKIDGLTDSDFVYCAKADELVAA
jgi:4a-hydroxytetrahydrobiopterin dehydratase